MNFHTDNSDGSASDIPLWTPEQAEAWPTWALWILAALVLAGLMGWPLLMPYWPVLVNLFAFRGAW